MFEDHIKDNKDKKVHDLAGRLIYPNSVIEKMKIDPSTLMPKKIRKAKEILKKNKDAEAKEKVDRWENQKHRGFLVLEQDTFVQAGVDQIYTFVTMVPEDTICCLIWCSFQYAQEPKKWQKTVSKISRKIGLIQYNLEHVQIPHTVEDVLWIAEQY